MQDETELAGLNESLQALEKDVEKKEFEITLSHPHDKLRAILTIHAGAGGTESCDWAQMLLRMYTRWAEQHQLKVSVTDVLPGEEAGIKNASIIVEGPYAYGYLKGENGVHRLVRVSPFDANARRHTSFASVDVLPDIEEEINIEIPEKDIELETSRAGGHGGGSPDNNGRPRGDGAGGRHQARPRGDSGLRADGVHEVRLDSARWQRGALRPARSLRDRAGARHGKGL